MAIPEGTPSLLLVLLEDLQKNPSLYSRDSIIQQNISAVVQALKPVRRPDLIKNVAQKQLYYVLYEIIEKAYKEPEHEPETDEGRRKAVEEREQNQILNGAIGMALENAIEEASRKKAAGTASPGDDMIITLRDELRRKILESLKPT
jgi:hypothetical protein